MAGTQPLGWKATVNDGMVCWHVLCRSSGSGSSGHRQLKDVQKPQHELPAPDARPEYHTVTATVAMIDPDQSLYYQACPENNRKVSSVLFSE